MPRHFRILWLPALAVLLPCVFIGVLSYFWYKVEGEVSGLRSTRAAQAIVETLRGDLDADLRAAAESAISTLGIRLASRPPFRPPPACADLCDDVFVFDASKALVDPNDVAMSAASPDSLLAAGRGWAALARIQALEDRGRRTEAASAAKTFLESAADPRDRAAALLVLTKLSAAAGHRDEAERLARTVFACCPLARDEFGMSFALYAGWQLVGLYQGTGDTDGLTTLAADLATLTEQGYLGTDSDAETVERIAARTTGGGHGTLAALATRVSLVRDRIARRTSLLQAAVRWVSDVDPGALSGQMLVRSLGSGAQATPAVLVASTGGHLVAMTLDRVRLESWVRRWATERGNIDISLPPAGASPRAPGEAISFRLFDDVPGLRMAVRRREWEETDDSRRMLLVLAVGGVLVLTLFVGALAARDVVREVRMASLRSAFVAGVTHELKTPLASIRLLAETLRQGRARPEVTRELLDTIVEDTERLGRLVDNVLSSSRIESGTLQYRPRIVSLRDAVREALRRFEHVLGSEGFRLRERFDDTPLPVHVDADALEQALLNLLGNAVKYSGASREIEIAVAERNGLATVSVADAGIGIPAADHARVFERFYRTTEARAHTTGAGLGLALVKHFAEAHGGRIDLLSTPGTGSVFTLSLPHAGAVDAIASPGLNAREPAAARSE